MPPPAPIPADQGKPTPGANGPSRTPATPSTPGTPRTPRTRGDACPGALRLHRADDGLLARLRLPGGILTDRQVSALATAAERYGDGHLTLTSRGNAELRGIGDACGGGLAELLRHTALLPSERHERIRNIVASPLAGLDGRGHGSLLPWLRELDALLCGEDWTAALSGRFLFVLDDGRGDVQGLGGDVTLLARGEHAVVRAGADALHVAADDAPRAALEAARAFLAAASAAGTGAWRVRELPPGHPVDLAAALAAAGIPATPAPDLAPGTPATPAPDLATGTPATTGPAPAPGILAGPGGTYAVLVAPVLGRLTGAQLRALPGPSGEIRATPWRGFVVPGFDERGAREKLRELGGAGFITAPDSPWAGVGACTGRPGCAKALADVRRDALPGTGGLPVHWSGCERRCGHPHGEWVDVTATSDGSYTVVVRGGAGERQVPVLPGELAEAVGAARDGGPPDPDRTGRTHQTPPDPDRTDRTGRTHHTPPDPDRADRTDRTDRTHHTPAAQAAGSGTGTPTR
ncbi:cobalamin biosynthesis protein CobG [Streptomyces sp. NPDC048111]|uniref:cobalamin biosynthesis protein CobG n=1 Tax=Streptomyces sp. NPDC048111 TaxID=3365500 RepID=UPI0037199E6D